MNNHRRYNPLLDEWVIVAENRMSRPWQGSTSSDSTNVFTKSDTNNPLAPGGKRANGMVTPEYSGTFVFENDFPSFTDYDTDKKNEEQEEQKEEGDPFFRRQEIRGTCRVICYSPDTSKNLATMSIEEILAVINVWIDQFNELKERFTWVQIFENKGAVVGCSNAHPHGQLWAGNFLPNLPKRKDQTQKDYKSRNSSVMLVDYVNKEVEKGERVIERNEHWTWLVPYWAVWPYETMLIPNRHVLRMDQLTQNEKESLAEILKLLLTKYDNVFKCSFPFGMGWLGAPTGQFLSDDYSHWQLHAIFHPPLLRSATVPKFMAGYEILAEPQRDITPEMAAETLRCQPSQHYTKEI